MQTQKNTKRFYTSQFSEKSSDFLHRLGWATDKNRGIAMQAQKNKKRFYTPQFSEKSSVSVRRLAWAMGVPMTQAIDILINELSLVFSPSVICPKCQDNSKCQSCAFNIQQSAEVSK